MPTPIVRVPSGAFPLPPSEGGGGITAPLNVNRAAPSMPTCMMGRPKGSSGISSPVVSFGGAFPPTNSGGVSRHHALPAGGGTATSAALPLHSSAIAQPPAGSLFVTMKDIAESYTFPEGGLRGTGGFGRVVHAQRTDGSHCALKVVGKQHGQRAEVVKDTIWREVSALRRVAHPNVVALHTAIDTPTAYYLDFELCKEDVFMYMRLGGKTPLTFSDTDAAMVTRQLADALLFLHHRHIAHLDVKLENILINTPSDVRLADFGFARELDGEIPTTITNGSGLYTPPEIIKAQLAQEDASRRGAATCGAVRDAPPLTRDCLIAMDMWCLGVVTFLLLSGRPPYRTRVASRADREDMLRRIASGLEFPEQRWGHMSATSKDFILKLLVEDPTMRMTAAAALQHSFLRGLV